MTDFFTPCWKNTRIERFVAGLWLALLILLAGVPALAVAGEAAAASEVTELRLERSPEGIVLFANVRLDLPPAVEDALGKGIAMVFLAEADVVRHRWYWTDRKIVSAQRHMRLAYQPLTRRWRLNVASGAIASNNLGLALTLNFDSLDEAMATMLRISAWKIADAGVIDADAIHRVEFRFGLDMSQLPRPFQIGAFGQSDWKVSVSASQELGPERPR